MRRLLRILRAALALLSLILCLALAYAWHRSHRTLTFVQWDHSTTHQTSAAIARGHIALHSRIHTPTGRPPDPRWNRIMTCTISTPPTPPPRFTINNVGLDDRDIYFWTFDREFHPLFRKTTDDTGPTLIALLEVTIPFWPPTFLAAVAPVAWTLVRPHRRRAQGLCPACGYDLRATPTRCPECGHTPAAAHTKLYLDNPRPAT